MSNRRRHLRHWFEPLIDLGAFLPRPYWLTRKMRHSVGIIAGGMIAFMLVPLLVPAPVDFFVQLQPALAASTANAKPASLPGSDATGAANPPGYVAPYGTYANPYYRGNCTYYVASRRQVPANWHNADNWLSAAKRAGWATGSTPQVGAIAQTSSGWAGHVAIVEQVSGSQVLVSEMNYHGFGVIDQRWAPASSFNYIY